MNPRAAIATPPPPHLDFAYFTDANCIQIVKASDLSGGFDLTMGLLVSQLGSVRDPLGGLKRSPDPWSH